MEATDRIKSSLKQILSVDVISANGAVLTPALLRQAIGRVGWENYEHVEMHPLRWAQYFDVGFESPDLKDPMPAPATVAAKPVLFGASMGGDKVFVCGGNKAVIISDIGN